MISSEGRFLSLSKAINNFWFVGTKHSWPQLSVLFIKYPFPKKSLLTLAHTLKKNSLKLKNGPMLQSYSAKI